MGEGGGVGGGYSQLITSENRLLHGMHYMLITLQ